VNFSQFYERCLLVLELELVKTLLTTRIIPPWRFWDNPSWIQESEFYLICKEFIGWLGSCNPGGFSFLEEQKGPSILVNNVMNEDIIMNED